MRFAETATQRLGVQLPRARCASFYQKTGDRAREAVNCNAWLAGVGLLGLHSGTTPTLQPAKQSVLLVSTTTPKTLVDLRDPSLRHRQLIAAHPKAIAGCLAVDGLADMVAMDRVDNPHHIRLRERLALLLP